MFTSYKERQKKLKRSKPSAIDPTQGTVERSKSKSTPSEFSENGVRPLVNAFDNSALRLQPDTSSIQDNEKPG
jgi:hypothetical protein